MALRRKPHTVTYTPQRNSNTGGRVDAPEDGTSSTLKVQITPMSTEQVIRQFGIEAIRPHMMMTEVGDGQNMKIGDRITWNGTEFYVKAPPQVWAAGVSTDHCDVLIAQEAE